MPTTPLPHNRAIAVYTEGPNAGQMTPQFYRAIVASIEAIRTQTSEVEQVIASLTNGTGDLSTLQAQLTQLQSALVMAAALGEVVGAGFMVRSDVGVLQTRTLTSGTLDISSPDGTDGDPVIDLAALADAGGGALLKIDRDQYGRVAGTSDPTTDDLAEGTENLYFTDARAIAAVGSLAGVLPVVTGEVLSGQPRFVYFDDGSLMYAEAA